MNKLITISMALLLTLTIFSISAFAISPEYILIKQCKTRSIDRIKYNTSMMDIYLPSKSTCKKLKQTLREDRCDIKCVFIYSGLEE